MIIEYFGSTVAVEQYSLRKKFLVGGKQDTLKGEHGPITKSRTDSVSSSGFPSAIKLKGKQNQIH